MAVLSKLGLEAIRRRTRFWSDTNRLLACVDVLVEENEELKRKLAEGEGAEDSRRLDVLARLGTFSVDTYLGSGRVEIDDEWEGEDFARGHRRHRPLHFDSFRSNKRG